jgi:hypothetical protein
MQAAFIRPAMKLRVVHSLQDRAINRAARSGIKYSGDSTHDFSVV